MDDGRDSLKVEPGLRQRLEKSLEFRRRETGFKITMAQETARLLSDALTEREKVYKKPGGKNHANHGR